MARCIRCLGAGCSLCTSKEAKVSESPSLTGLDPVIFKERKQRWLDATELLRDQRLAIYQTYATQTLVIKDERIEAIFELPEVMKDMVDYIDQQIVESAKEIVGKGV